MKSSFRALAFLFLALCASVLLRAESYSFKEPFTQSAPFNATGEISLETVNGAVEIRTWDKNEIRIEGEKSAKTDEELKLIDLTLHTTPERVTIKVRLPKRPGSWFGGGNIRASVRFTLTVPATAHLKQIEAVNARIVLDGLRGTVHAETVNGPITATALGGDTHLETVNGRINASFATLTAAQRISMETVNGAITVTLPPEPHANLEASVVNGHIDCDFPITLSSGRLRGKNLKGTIGHGGATIELEAVNGSLALRAK